jgi:hypothetical protein
MALFPLKIGFFNMSLELTPNKGRKGFFQFSQSESIINMNETFTINLGDTVHLTDPCYDSSDKDFDNGTYFFTPCVSGEWAITLLKNERGYHAGIRGQSKDSSTHRTENGFAFVDSGQFGIFDATIFDDNKEYDNLDNFYGKACNFTLSREGCGVVDNAGFVSRTAYGDGSYDITMFFNENDKLTQFEITFISHEDWDEEDLSDEEWNEFMGEDCYDDSSDDNWALGTLEVD